MTIELTQLKHIVYRLFKRRLITYAEYRKLYDIEDYTWLTDYLYSEYSVKTTIYIRGNSSIDGNNECSLHFDIESFIKPGSGVVHISNASHSNMGTVVRAYDDPAGHIIVEVLWPSGLTRGYSIKELSLVKANKREDNGMQMVSIW